jgi:hypothetical protein
VKPRERGTWLMNLECADQRQIIMPAGFGMTSKLLR